MKFDEIYPDAESERYYGCGLYKTKQKGECLICQEPTNWQFVWAKESVLSIPFMVKSYICCDRCLDYYEIMKELM